MKGTRAWVVIGEITKPHGVRGAVRVLPHTDYPQRFDSLSEVYLGTDDDPEPKQMSFSLLGWQKDQLICRLGGVDSRDAAEKLRGKLLMVPREEAVPLPEGYYYIFDLVGLAVHTEDGEYLGRLKEVLQPGANDVYIVEAADGSGEILLPAIKEVILDVNLREGRMLVRLLPGLLEEE
ncbi:MAG TPA: 16S rRNA processing protein RimM [Firmicutes bacterium]|nr:16S rRNA processing protein RimM [Bacillota bacterium]